MSHLRHARDDSRSNESEALSVLSTWESVAMVSFSTAAHGATLGVLDEGVHDGVLLARQDPSFAQQDCYIRAIPDGDYCGSLCARQRLHPRRTSSQILKGGCGPEV